MHPQSHQLLKEAVSMAGLKAMLGGVFKKGWGAGIKKALAPAAKGVAGAAAGGRMARAAKVIGAINPFTTKATKYLLGGGIGLYALNNFLPEAPQGPTSDYQLEMVNGVPMTKNREYSGRNAVAQHALRYVPIGTKLGDVTNFRQAWVKEMEKNPDAIRAMEEAGRPILTSKRPDQIPGMKKYPGLWEDLKPHVNKTVSEITGFKPRSGI
jgi:hypothetical protein